MKTRWSQYFLCCLGLVFTSISFAFVAHTNILGLMQNNVYNNSIIGFSLKFPESFTLNDNPPNPTFSSQLNDINDNALSLFTVINNHYGMSAKVINLTVPADAQTADQTLEQSKLVLLRTAKLEVASVSPIQHVKLNGLAFSKINLQFKLNQCLLNETLYATVRNDHVLVFITAYSNAQEQTEIQHTLDTLLFY